MNREQTWKNLQSVKQNSRLKFSSKDFGFDVSKSVPKLLDESKIFWYLKLFLISPVDTVVKSYPRKLQTSLLAIFLKDQKWEGEIYWVSQIIITICCPLSQGFENRFSLMKILNKLRLKLCQAQIKLKLSWVEFSWFELSWVKLNWVELS